MPGLCCCGLRRRLNQASTDVIASVREAHLLPHSISRLKSPWIRSICTKLTSCSKHNSKSSTTSVPESTDLDQLVIEDDSDSENGNIPNETRSTAVIGALRRRIFRHLPPVKKTERHPPVKVGSSEEEIARRAELRRLRCQRIQEELKTDEKNGSENSGRSDSVPSITLPLNSSPLSGGPRDMIEFTVPSSLKLRRSERSEVSNIEKSDSMSSDEKISLTDQGKADTPVNGATPRAGGDIPISSTHKTLVERISFQVPLSTLEKSARSPEDIKTENCSAPPLEGQILQRTETASWDGQSALDIWILTQRLHSPECSATKLTPGTVNGAIPKERSIAAKDNSGKSPENADDGPLSSELTMADESPGTSSGENIETSDRLSERPKPCSCADLLLSPSQDLQEKYALVMAYSNITKTPLENGSSHYTSGMPSFEGSPVRSETNLPGLCIQELRSLQLSPFSGQSLKPTPLEEPEEHTSSSHTTVDDENANLGSEKGDDAVDLSPTANELIPRRPSSLSKRELELESIQKRFGDVMYRKKTSIPRPSRFSEDFDDKDKPKSHRTSFVDKVQLTIPRRSKDASRSIGSIDRNFLSPIDRRWTRRSILDSSADTRGNGRSEASSGVYLRSQPEESATDLWGRAIRLEAERRGSTSSHSIMRKSDCSTYNAKSRLSQASPRSSYIGGIEHSRIIHAEDERSALSARSDSYIFGSAVHNIFSPLRTKYQKQTTTREAWGKFPSHTRQERNHIADIRDQVKTRDFAVRVVSDDGQVCWSTDKSSPSPAGEARPGSDSMRRKLRKAVKSGLVRIFLAKDEPTMVEPPFREGFRHDPRILAEIELAELEALAMEAEQKESRKSRELQLSMRQLTAAEAQAPATFSRKEATICNQTDGANPDLSVASCESPPESASLEDISHERDSTPKSEVFLTPFSSNIPLDAQAGSVEC